MVEEVEVFESHFYMTPNGQLPCAIVKFIGKEGFDIRVTFGEIQLPVYHVDTEDIVVVRNVLARFCHHFGTSSLPINVEDLIPHTQKIINDMRFGFLPPLEDLR